MPRIVIHLPAPLAVLLPLVFATLLSERASAQTTADFAGLPACAQSCVNLVNGQASCASNPATYLSCFCQSALLVNLRAGSGADCAAACPDQSDQSAIQQWYTSYCNGGLGGPVQDGKQAPPPSVPATSSTGTATSSSSGATSTRNTNAVINDYDGDGDPGNNYTGSWISAHWQWVLMLVIIFVAMVSSSILGVCLKRRHRAKRDAELRGRNMPGGSNTMVEGGNPIGAIPQPPSTVYFKNANESGTLNSTGDLGAPNRSHGNRLDTRVRFLNSTTGQTAQVNHPVVWGPHQHQAATRGYEYPGGASSPVPSTLTSIPTPSATPVGGYSKGAKHSTKGLGRDVVVNEDRIEFARNESNGMRKLSKR